MIVLFTDYGLQGPYLGEVEAVLFRYAPGQRVITLFADVPRQNPQAGAYLLAAYGKDFPKGTIFFCVVDPAVGSARDKPVVLRIGDHRYVGPHNGLFDILSRRAGAVECWEITWQAEDLSTTFHGRDLYAPVCAMLTNQQPVPGKRINWRARHDWPDDLEKIIYVDHFGNLISGMRAEGVDASAVVSIGGQAIYNAATFAAVKKGEAFWYANSSGLLEIAVNHGSAAAVLSADIGAKIGIG